MVVHPAPGTPSGTLVNALIHHCGTRSRAWAGCCGPGIVHRIDKDTSGLVVAAKSDRAHQGLAAQFAAHEVERHYLALCHGAPVRPTRGFRPARGLWEAGAVLRIATRLDRHRTRPPAAGGDLGGGRHAVTRARVVEAFGTPPAAALLDCWLETGRTHQIRVHLAYAGLASSATRPMAGAARPRAGPWARQAPRRPGPSRARRSMRRRWASSIP
jgi:23S rRNA pseudouridine1911/1915/1917 synthase